MIRRTNFQFLTNKNDRHLPLAIARFTAFDNNDKLLTVEQITYENNAEYFQSEVSAALECGVDVSVISPYELEDFKWLSKLVNA